MTQEIGDVSKYKAEICCLKKELAAAEAVECPECETPVFQSEVDYTHDAGNGDRIINIFICGVGPVIGNFNNSWDGVDTTVLRGLVLDYMNMNFGFLGTFVASGGDGIALESTTFLECEEGISIEITID